MTTTEMNRTNGQAEMTRTSDVHVAPRGPVLPALITDEHRAILKGMIDRNATPSQIEMLIVIGNRYDLDPLMGHVVLIQGKCFVTHKGLVHKAHTSGQFDGMETAFGRDDIGEYAETHVWRKDMSRPFVGRIYIDEYANSNPVWKSCRHGMAAKTSESFTLRRAMDVSLTSQEEMGIADDLPPAPPLPAAEKAERKSLSEKIGAASKALTKEQFAAFKTKVAESGGLGEMQTQAMRDLLAQVEAVAEANEAVAEQNAALEPEHAAGPQAGKQPPPSPQGEKQPAGKQPAGKSSAAPTEAEDDPFADE